MKARLKWNGRKRQPWWEDIVKHLINALKGFFRLIKSGPFGSQPVIYDDHSHALRGE